MDRHCETAPILALVRQLSTPLISAPPGHLHSPRRTSWASHLNLPVSEHLTTQQTTTCYSARCRPRTSCLISPSTTMHREHQNLYGTFFPMRCSGAVAGRHNNDIAEKELRAPESRTYTKNRFSRSLAQKPRAPLPSHSSR